jgi:hypothetical protein
MARNKRSFNFADFDFAESAFDLFQNSIRSGMDYDANISDQFQAKVLTRPTKLTGDPRNVSFVAATENKTEIFAFMVRIQGKQSPHRFLPDPCRLEYTKTSEQRTRAFNSIQLHTKVLMSPDSESPLPSIDDIVNITLERGAFGSFKTDLAKQYVSIVSEATIPSGKKIGACQTLAQMFTKADIINSGLLPTSYNTYRRKTNSLEPSAQTKFDKFLAAAESDGYRWEITSARRSVKHQWNLYTGRITGATPAAPCDSDHQYGYALDLNFKKGAQHLKLASSDAEWEPIVRLAIAAGLRWQGSSDRVHFSDPKGKTGALKKKCRAIYYNETNGLGPDPWSWPDDFLDLHDAISESSSDPKTMNVRANQSAPSTSGGLGGRTSTP